MRRCKGLYVSCLVGALQLLQRSASRPCGAGAGAVPCGQGSGVLIIPFFLLLQHGVLGRFFQGGGVCRLRRVASSCWATARKCFAVWFAQRVASSSTVASSALSQSRVQGEKHALPGVPPFTRLPLQWEHAATDEEPSVLADARLPARALRSARRLMQNSQRACKPLSP